MKKIIAMLLAALMLLSLAACGSEETVLNTEYTAEELMNMVVEQVEIPFMAMANPVQVSSEDSAYFLGLTDSKALVEVEAVVYEAMVSALAFSASMVKLVDTADAETVKNEILNGVDMRKWICVEAEKLIVVDNGQYVLMVMGPVDLAQSMAAAFDTVLEADNGTALEKDGAAPMDMGETDMVPAFGG